MTVTTRGTIRVKSARDGARNALEIATGSAAIRKTAASSTGLATKSRHGLATMKLSGVAARISVWKAGIAAGAVRIATGGATRIAAGSTEGIATVPIATRTAAMLEAPATVELEVKEVIAPECGAATASALANQIIGSHPVIGSSRRVDTRAVGSDRKIMNASPTAGMNRCAAAPSARNGHVNSTRTIIHGGNAR